jgi:hypothetical protein
MGTERALILRLWAERDLARDMRAEHGLSLISLTWTSHSTLLNHDQMDHLLILEYEKHIISFLYTKTLGEHMYKHEYSLDASLLTSSYNDVGTNGQELALNEASCLL